MMEQNVLEEEIWKIDECGAEKVSTLLQTMGRKRQLS